MANFWNQYGFYVVVAPAVALLLFLIALLFPGKLSLTFKQMRQRSLSTWLTILLVTLGMALEVSVLLAIREGGKVFGQSDYGCDVLVGHPGSPLQLTINTLYHLDVSPGNIPYRAYEQLQHDANYRQLVRIAVPYAVGDSYEGRYRIVGTPPKLFGVDDSGNPLPAERVMGYRLGENYQMAQGRPFAPDKFEAVIGSEVAARTSLRLGSQFQATHGMPGPNDEPDIHPEKWTVVGVLEPTHTANDRVIFIPLTTFYTIAEHGSGLIAQEALREGRPVPEHTASRPATHDAEGSNHHEEHGDDRQHENYTVDAEGRVHLSEQIEKARAVSAILVKSRGGISSSSLIYTINNGGMGLMAVSPAQEMRGFFDTFLKPANRLLVIIAALVSIEAAASILVSIYNSVSARRREIAILRALGATRTTVVGLICLEAGLIALFGSILGLLAGHAAGALGSVYLRRTVGQGINPIPVGGGEVIYLLAVVGIGVLAGLVPAMKAYRTPVAANLAAG